MDFDIDRRNHDGLPRRTGLFWGDYVLTWPPTRNRANVAPGFPADAPDSQTEIPGFPSACSRGVSND